MVPLSLHQLLAKSLPILRMVPKIDEGDLLEEFFNPFPELAHTLALPYDMARSLGQASVLPEQEAVIFAAAPQIPLSTPIHLRNTQTTPPTFVFSVSGKIAHSPLILPEQPLLAEADYHYKFSDSLSKLPPLLEVESEQEEILTSLSVNPNPTLAAVETTPTPLQPIRVDKKTTLERQKTLSLPLTPLPALDQKEIPLTRSYAPAKPLHPSDAYKLPQQKIVSAAADQFDADVRFMKAPTGGGYIFAINLKTVKNDSLDRMRQNFTFLIDRSNSIEKHHFSSFKGATLRALSMLKPGDHFNIVVFDKKAVSFRPKPVAYSKKNLEAAEKFLGKQQSGGLFAAADLYEFLPKLIPAHAPEDEVNTLILLSDGATDTPLKRRQPVLNKFIKEAREKVTLYAAAVGRNNDLELLDAFSTATGGALLHSDTYAAFSRRLAGLVHRIRQPLAKEITVSILDQKMEAGVRLYPQTSSVLYTGQPYEIVGRIEHLTDFTLFIQGLYEGEGFQIKKPIQFSTARKDPSFVTKLWEEQKSRRRYKRVLDNPSLAKKR